MVFNFTELGRSLFWFSLLFTVYIIAFTILFVSCGFYPEVLKFIPHLPTLDTIANEVQKYIMNGQPIPVSVSALLFATIFVNIILNLSLSFAMLFSHILVLLQAPLPIVFIGFMIGLFLDIIKIMYVAAVILGRAPFG